MKQLKRYFPIIEWLPNYSRKNLGGDITAGLTVGIMLIPQGMAYALLAGVPPIYGLYASLAPLLLYAFFGTSRQLSVGPVAMDSLLIASGVSKLAETGSDQYIQLTILLAFMVGVIQFAFGVFRMGFLVNFLSKPVISGFTAAAALIIGLSQLTHLLGVDIPRSRHVHTILISAVQSLTEIHWPTLLMGVGGILVLVFSKRYLKKIPGSLIIVVLGTLVVWVFKLDTGGMKTVGAVPAGMPSFSIPTFDLQLMQDMGQIAFTIALVGFMEAIAVGKAINARHKEYKIDPSQELIAIGMSNIGGAFFQSFAVTGGFSRSAVNDQAGAKTNLASIISALIIGLTLLFLTPLFYYLPKSMLAALIMVAVFGLIDIEGARKLWKVDKRDFVMMLITFLATLLLGIELGIGIGVVLSLIMVIYLAAYPHSAELGKIKGTDYFRNVTRFGNLETREDVLVFRFDARLFYANVGFFRDKLAELETKREGKLKSVILNFESIPSVDSTAIQMMNDLVDDYHLRGIELRLTGCRGPVRDMFHKTGLVNDIGANSFFMTDEDAMQDYLHSLENPSQKKPIKDTTRYTLQTNETKDTREM